MGIEELRALIGRVLVGRDGKRIGTIAEVYVDHDTVQPAWAALSAGWFDNRRSFVPLFDTAPEGDEIVVPYTKDQVKESARLHPQGGLSTLEEARLFEHYGLGRAGRLAARSLKAR